MNWLVFLLTIWFVCWQLMASWDEGTITRSSWRKVKMPFLYHGGMWGDFLIMPIVNGLIWNHLDAPLSAILITLALTGAITLAMHWLWGENPETRYQGHMWLPLGHNSWFRDLSIAGWLHVVFMTGEMTILALYVISPTPPTITTAVGILLTVFWPLGSLQPCYVMTGRWFDRNAVLASIAIVAGTWTVTAWKLWI